MVSLVTCPSSNWSAEKPVVVEINAMSRYPKISKAERVGCWMGKTCCRVLRQERRLWSGLWAKQLPVILLFTVKWSVRLALIAALAYLSFWLLLVALLLVLASRISVPEGEYGRHEVDHRQTLYYDPINYNDDPDPRFDGE